MIRRFRPTWSLDIEKTKRWLAEMSSRGYHLHKINIFTAWRVLANSKPVDR